MIDLHVVEVLEEIRDSISEHLSEIEGAEDVESRAALAEELLQEILETISPFIERETE
jgi:hypothetical protein